MAIILNIETSTRACSAALAKNGKTVALKEAVEEGYSHAEKLNLFIEDVLKQAGMSLGQLHAVAVSKGPGSYTGLRIGVSTAKGLAYALDIPLLGIETLAALAAGFSEKNRTGEEDLLVPMIDARRKEVYMQIFDARLQWLTKTEAAVIHRGFFSEKFDGKRICLFGDGAGKFREEFKGNKKICITENFWPSADFMASLSFENFTAGRFENLAYFEPYYLKDFIAIKSRDPFA